MLIGFLFGLVSATANGTANILGAVAARRAGVLIAPMVVLTVALVFMSLFAWASGLSFNLGPGDMPLLIFLGAIVALGFMLFYQALRVGPVSVVSSIMATSGAASVLFAVVLLDEHPSVIQWAAVPVSAVGAVLATRGRRNPDGAPSIGMGPLYAAMTVVTGGCSNALIRIPIVEHGPVQAVVVQRFFTVVFIVLLGAGAAIIRRRRSSGDRGEGAAVVARPRDRGGWPSTVALLVLMGAIDATGFIGFAFGMAVAPAWLLGLVSQSGRLAAACIATAVFRENLRPIQWIGIALVAIGLGLAVWP
jgi:drug/metabolite transporter (DMT)-like permease